MPITKNIFLKLGFFPLVDHYYDPLFDYRKVRVTNYRSHLNFNDQVQLNFLSTLRFTNELIEIPMRGNTGGKFYHENGSFGGGDAELYYSIIRKNKPKRILEVGSGYSTLLALKAIEKNKAKQYYTCELTCIEPYEMPYLEAQPVTLIRKKVEELSIDIFSKLETDDILFIDSSHIIRPGGDVTYLLLEVLPTLNPGVWIHFHDIFIPEEYPQAWLENEFRMWNEQYLLFAFLIGNDNFEIICSLNYLRLEYKSKVTEALPAVAKNPEARPGSFWIRRK